MIKTWYEFEKKLNRENIINNKTLEYLVAKGISHHTIVEHYERLYNIVSSVFDNEHFEFQLKIGDPNSPGSLYVRIAERKNLPNFRVELRLVIKYDNIEIVNSKGIKLPLKDVFVILDIESSRDNPSIRSPLGFRTTFSEAEFLSGYSHSHLPGFHTPHFSDKEYIMVPQPFCLGTNPFSSISYELGYPDRFTDERFKLLLFGMQPYLSWESLEGGPFRKMESVFNKSTPLSEKRELTPLMNDFINKLFLELVEHKKISYEYDLETCTYKIVDDDEYEKFLIKYLGSQLCFKAENGKYYAISNTVRDTKPYEDMTKFSVVFQGKELKLKITTNEVDTSKKYVQPFLRKVVTNSLNAMLTTKLIKYYDSTNATKANPTNGTIG